jgi:16S rRNA (cytosine(967)-C(5))-methyltransferase
MSTSTTWSSYRLKHLFDLLDGYPNQTLPIDQYLQQHYRRNTSLGSKDRILIAEAIYEIVRWQGLFTALLQKNLGRAATLRECFQSYQAQEHREDHPGLKPHERVSCPPELFNLLIEAYGLDRAIYLGRVSNESAPVTVRVNQLKSSRDQLFQQWKAQGLPVVKGELSSDAILFTQRIAVFQLPEFQQGLFEMQDENSQLVADLITVKPGEHVLDFCAGSGGKALAIGARMQQKGQLYLHDIRTSALQQARKRLARAGVQNVQILEPGHKQWSRLTQKLDWVLVDAPCTGTGTLRRNPDMKWRFTQKMLQEVIEKQHLVMTQAVKYLKPSGRIVYSTCSILPQENQMQVERFCKEFLLEVEGELMAPLPESGKGDGFFGAIMRRKYTQAT